MRHQKQPLFRRKIFSENLVVWSSYLFLITTYWSRIPFLISYFLKINTFSAQLLFRRSFFSRISNYSEHILFKSSYFFQKLLPNTSSKYFFQILLPNTSFKYFFQILLPNTSSKYSFIRTTFLGADIYQKNPLFRIVLRNQFQSIYT